MSDVSSEPRFPFLAVDVPSRRADELGALLFELGATGVEVRDDATLQKGPGGDVVTLVASFAETAHAQSARGAMQSAEPSLRCEVGEIVGDAWRDKYKEYFKPFALTEHLVIAPPWEHYEPSAAETVLVMDPGRAFGTGLHATTSMVAGLLEAHRSRLQGAQALDVGTGSGILGLVGLRLGVSAVIAIDTDADVIEIAAGNAVRNGMGDAMHVSDMALAKVQGSFDVVMANIRSEVLITMVDALAARARSGALVVLSGILATEQDDVMSAFAADFDHVETRSHEEGTDAWVAIALTRR